MQKPTSRATTAARKSSSGNFSKKKTASVSIPAQMNRSGGARSATIQTTTGRSKAARPSVASINRASINRASPSYMFQTAQAAYRRDKNK